MLMLQYNIRMKSRKSEEQQMIEIATVRNELDRTSGKLKDFSGSL